MSEIFKIHNTQSIQLSEVDPAGIRRVQIIRTGEFPHPDAPNGVFKVDRAMLEKFISNYDLNVYRQEVGFDYRHDVNGPSAGGIKSLEIIDNSEMDGLSELWGDVDWTPRAEKEILEKEWRYISADVTLNYKDNESGVEHGPLLFGAALVNRPHIKSMSTIFSEQQLQTKGSIMSPEEMLRRIEELNKIVGELEAKMNGKDNEISSAEDEMKEVKSNLENSEKVRKEQEGELTTLKTEVEDTKKEAKFSELLSEGKIVPAQKEGFMKMELKFSETFFKDAVAVVNLNEKGHGEDKTKNGEGDNTEGDTASDKLIKLSETAMKGDKSLDFSKALRDARAENPKLAIEADKE